MKKIAEGSMNLQVIAESELNKGEFLALYNEENIVDVYLKVRLIDGTWKEIKGFLPEIIWNNYYNNED